MIVKFTVDRFGRIKDVSAIKKPLNGDAYAKEAENVIKHMPDWKPGKKNGLLVHVSYTLTIRFAPQK